MIFGIWDPHQSCEALVEQCRRAASAVAAGAEQRLWCNGHVVLGCLTETGATLSCGRRQTAVAELARVQRAAPAAELAKVHGPKSCDFGYAASQMSGAAAPNASGSQDATLPVTLALQGAVYNASELAEPASGRCADATGDAAGLLARRYAGRGDRFLEQVNGKFALAAWDGQHRHLVLATDHLGIEPLFYVRSGERVAFASSTRLLLAAGWAARQIETQALLTYLLFCFNPGQQTMIRGLQRVPAGHVLTFDGQRLSQHRYWKLSYAQLDLTSEEEICHKTLDLMRQAIGLRLGEGQIPGVLLSGGTDSSAIVSLTSELTGGPIRTFSFRCQGRSYDESPYARLVAERYAAEHTEIAYEPECVQLISDAVRWMDEPFCDLGIEMATYLMGQRAAGTVSFLLSGEGGDELFGGHPVYFADKMAPLADCLPRMVTAPMLAMLQKLPDSQEKKNLQVKLKRFAYGLAFPGALLSHRWRVYYTPDELRQFCEQDFLNHCDWERQYEAVLQINAQADGRDILSRCLYSDFFTLVNFYTRRLGLLRAFGLDSRTPLLDFRLAEFSARIPAKLKVRGLSQTKYIYRKALEAVLPREILYDRPKLGHSVPMKNWLRQDPRLRQWALDILTSSSFCQRGLLRAERVQQLLDEHTSKSHNHSHRIWSLIVLELWLQTHIDANP